MFKEIVMESVILLKIGEKLSLLRNQKGVTQEAVADALGISNKTISKWETGLSVPETEYIPMLSDYFNVSTDEIFGRTTSKSSMEDIIAKEYDGLSHFESVNKSFALAFEVIRQSLWKIGNNPSSEKVVPEHIISSNENMYRASVSNDIGYEMFINSPYTNLSVMLFQNECDFSWMDDDSQEFSNLFRLLGDIDGIKMVKLMYTQGFPSTFTADYIAKKADMEEEKAKALLEYSVNAKVCAKLEANLRDGKTDLYHCHHSGMVLAILNLAFELVCGQNNNEYWHGGRVKMIRGDKNENR
jgi:transcriptional regulator with XRE-family HTH domain